MKNKLLSLALLIVLLGSILIGCDLSAKAGAAVPINLSKSLKTDVELQEIDELDEAHLEGLSKFAFDMFIKQRDGENIFISPYSISSALSMVYNGADGKTRNEIAELLGYDVIEGYTPDYSKEANSDMNYNVKYLIDALLNADPKVQINVANSIWMAEGIQFNDTIDEALLAPVREYYGADIFQVDFTLDETLEQVNKWVSHNTDKMIDPFIEQFQDKESLMLFIANAIYFNGKWTLPFEKSNTRQTPFYGREGTKEVDMMHMSGEQYRYLAMEGVRGVEIPYGNENLVMNVLIPEDPNNVLIGDLLAGKSSEELNQFLLELDKSSKIKLGTLALPKFEMEYGTVDVTKALKELGMEEAFTDNANFSLIGDNIFISTISHKAKIEVEEWGTKAAAATGLDVNTTSMPLDPPINFIVDVPFVFTIRDKATGTILFIGEMNNIHE
ncbi:MAG TPA: serpin family protein [Clostridiales bacterium]|nr:serpin family protein [Clostridiales bacterium]